MRRKAILTTILAATLLPAALAAQAAPARVQEDTDCQGNDRHRDRYCEVREFTLEARPSLDVDAGQNGGIHVTGWDRDEVRLEARIQASSRNDDPRALAREVEIRTGAVIEADGPRTGGRDSWAVSFELMVPRATALRLGAHNGGIGVEGLTGDVEARTTNGGLSVAGGAGRVRGHTTNGGIRLELSGSAWQGEGVDLETTNGGVRITVPEDYSARLETGTVNGGIQMDIPIMVQGRLDRTIRTELGNGGSMIRAVTTNGGVVVERGRG